MAAGSAGRILIGRFRLEHLVATGGMAEVWEATDLVLHRSVAVKVLLPHLAASPGFGERFRREAVAAARLAHPNIVATFDTGIDEPEGEGTGPLSFIVMELVRGETLRDRIARGPLSVPDAVAVAIQMGVALDHAHRAGLVHRDVKPGNVLLAPDGTVKVTDFGIAKLSGDDDPTMDGDLTRTGSIVGTAKYLSPEQAQGHEPDARSDVYALGVVLYEMVAGTAPFEAPTDVATALAHVQSPVPSLVERCPAAPGPLVDVVERALAKAPEDRPPTAAALARELLDLHLADDAVPLAVGDPTPPRGVTPLARRRRRPTMAAAVLVLGVVIAGAAVAIATRGGTGADPEGPRAEARAVGVTPRSFDPEGRDRAENEDEAPLAADGDTATAWRTDRYRTPAFGNLKEGVGLVLVLDAEHTLTQLELRTASDGWAGTIYVAPAVAEELGGWGRPVAEVVGSAPTTTIDLAGSKGRAVLIWITDLGPGNNRFAVEEVEVRARP